MTFRLPSQRRASRPPTTITSFGMCYYILRCSTARSTITSHGNLWHMPSNPWHMMIHMHMTSTLCYDIHIVPSHSCTCTRTAQQHTACTCTTYVLAYTHAIAHTYAIAYTQAACTCTTYTHGMYMHNVRTHARVRTHVRHAAQHGTHVHAHIASTHTQSPAKHMHTRTPTVAWAMP